MTTNYTSPGGGSADEAKRKLEGAAETVKADVAAAKDDVAARAKSVAERGKETGVGHLDAFADAVHKAADELGEKDESAAAQFVREAAGGLESLSVSLREKSVGDLVDSVSRFGRSNPTAFLGGALLAGVALGRFAQSSGKRSHGAHDAGHGRESGMASTGSAMPSSPSGRPTASPGGTTGHGAAARPFPSAVNTGGTNDAIR